MVIRRDASRSERGVDLATQLNANSPGVIELASAPAQGSQAPDMGDVLIPLLGPGGGAGEQTRAGTVKERGKKKATKKGARLNDSQSRVHRWSLLCGRADERAEWLPFCPRQRSPIHAWRVLWGEPVMVRVQHSGGIAPPQSTSPLPSTSLFLSSQPEYLSIGGGKGREREKERAELEGERGKRKKGKRKRMRHLKSCGPTPPPPPFPLLHAAVLVPVFHVR